MVEAARRLGPGFADGVRFVELAAVSAADLVAPAIAAGLGLSTSAGQLTADLQAYLRPRRLLLAVDNFEQVLTAAALLAGLLAAAPGLVVLATSRAVLRLSGEHEFAVPPLPIPPAGTALDPAGLLDYASVRLFTERAHAAAPDFQLTGDNAAAVAEICRRLDGLPLAIELAAARLRLLPPQALASRLGQRFSLLTGGPRDLPQRQQTLRNTLDWSFGLLSAAEQALFTRLGVFAGPFSLPAAEAIGADAPEEGHAPGAGELMDTLGSLVDSSLVRPQTRYGEPWFALLETIREYALDRLREGGEWTEAHDRHAAYFLALAEPAAADLAGPGQLAWLDRLEAEHDNLWAAMSWLVDHGPLEQAVHLSQVAWRFWWLRGHAAELARLGDDFVAGSEDLPSFQHAVALTRAGFILIGNGDPARGQQLLEQTLPLYCQVSEKLGVLMNATVLATLGHLAATRRDYADAGKLLDHGRTLLAEVRGDDLAGYDRLQYLLTAALLYNCQHDHDGAAQLFTNGLAVARRAQDWSPLLVSLYDLALARQAQGDLAGAAEHLQEGLALAAQAGDETSAAYYLEVLAAVAAQQDNPRRAVRLFAAARSILDARGSGWLHAFVPRVPHDDAALAALRSPIGDAAFDQAQAWGRSAGSKPAVEYALQKP
jgi:predicted ATPase